MTWTGSIFAQTCFWHYITFWLHIWRHDIESRIEIEAKWITRRGEKNVCSTLTHDGYYKLHISSLTAKKTGETGERLTYKVDEVSRERRRTREWSLFEDQQHHLRLRVGWLRGERKNGKDRKRERGIKEKNTREDIEYHSPLIFLQNHLLPGKRKLSMSWDRETCSSTKMRLKWRESWEETGMK